MGMRKTGQGALDRMSYTHIRLLKLMSALRMCTDAKVAVRGGQSPRGVEEHSQRDNAFPALMGSNKKEVATI